MKDERRNVEIIRQARILDGFFKAEEAYVRFEKFNREMRDETRFLDFARGNAVAVAILDTDSDELPLVEQARYPTHSTGPEWTVEFVAGMLGSEDPVAAVRREVLEETGY